MYKQHDTKSTYIVFPEEPNDSTSNAVFKHLTHRVPVFVEGCHVWGVVGGGLHFCDNHWREFWFFLRYRVCAFYADNRKKIRGFYIWQWPPTRASHLFARGTQ